MCPSGLSYILEQFIYLYPTVTFFLALKFLCLLMDSLCSLCRKTDNVEAGAGKWVSYLNREKKLDLLVGQRPIAPPAPKGLYIYGNVGSGLLLHLFPIFNRRINAASFLAFSSS